MGTYGITSAGFVIPTLAQMKAGLGDAYKAIYGTPNLADDSIIGIRIGIMAKQLVDAWEALQAVYNAPFPGKCDDASFPDVMDLVGLQMLPAAKSQVVCQCTGDEGTVIPAGSLITSDLGNVFELTAQVTIPGAGTIDGTFQAVDAGPVPVDEDTTWNITTSISGWSAAANDDAGNVGRLAETVAEARLRRARSLQVIGASALDAIVSRVLNEVPNVTYCSGFENPGDTVDADGRPAHSIEILVTGGLDQDIAEKIWSCKSGGIATVGTYDAVVADSQGNNHTVKFTRPTAIDVAVEVTITRYTEESLPTNYEDLIIAAVAAYAATFKIGQDLLIDRWLVPVYGSTSGVDKVTIRQKKGAGAWETDDVAMAYNEYPGTVTVTVVGP
jgi:uncharacterized phage protein gp47/JayE